jgi:hypothetical protein
MDADMGIHILLDEEFNLFRNEVKWHDVGMNKYSSAAFPRLKALG